jgi:hypothetical protein
VAAKKPRSSTRAWRPAVRSAAELRADVMRLMREFEAKAFLLDTAEDAEAARELGRLVGSPPKPPNQVRGDAKRWLLVWTEVLVALLFGRRVRGRALPATLAEYFREAHGLHPRIAAPARPRVFAWSWLRMVQHHAHASHREPLRELVPELEIGLQASIRVAQVEAVASAVSREFDDGADAERIATASLRALGCGQRQPFKLLDAAVQRNVKGERTTRR